MTALSAPGPVKRVQIEAVVIRADGTREDLGVVADSKWKFFDPRKLRSVRRIRAANRRQGERS